MSTNNTEYLVAIERRIAALERRLIGEEKIREGQPSLIRLINAMNGKLRALGDSVEVVKEVWKRDNELEKHLQTSRTPVLNERAKEELLLSYTEHLVKIQDQLEDINKLQESINSPSFRGLEKESRDLSKLAGQHIDQEKDAERLTNRVQVFIDNYTKLLMTLSQQCVDWNDQLST